MSTEGFGIVVVKLYLGIFGKFVPDTGRQGKGQQYWSIFFMNWGSILAVRLSVK